MQQQSIVSVGSIESLNPVAVNFRKFGKTFWRSQGTALLATFIDYGSLLFFVEVGKIYYVWAVAMAAFLGAVTNYTTNRIWAFQSRGPISGETVRYFIVSLASMLWNVALVWIFTEFFGIVYYASKIIVAILVGWFWNYPIHRYWVFVGDKINENA